jgi:hypothetical protein
MAVRKVSNRGGNIIGRFPSLKLARMVAFESLLERDFIYLLDFEADISWFAEQPLTISYQHKEKLYHYTPDFHIIKDGQHLLIECKPQKFIGKADNQRKFSAAQAWCAAKNWQFQVVSDVELRQNYRVHNVKLLTQFARYTIQPALKYRIHTFLASTAVPVSVFEAMTHVAPAQPQTLLIPILHMAFHHEVVLPLNHAPISTHSQVHLASQVEKECYP